MKKLPKVNTSKLLKAALPYILVGLMATKLGQAYRMASGGDVLDRILGAFLKIGEAFANPLPSLHPFDLLVGDACGALLWFIVYQKSKNARKYRRGAEYGTARWGNSHIDLRFGCWLTSDRNEGGGERHRGMTSGQHDPKQPHKNAKAPGRHEATRTHEMT